MGRSNLNREFILWFQLQKKSMHGVQGDFFYTFLPSTHHTHYFTTTTKAEDVRDSGPLKHNKVRSPPTACRSPTAAAKSLRPPTKKETPIDGASVAPGPQGHREASLTQEQTSPQTRGSATNRVQWPLRGPRLHKGTAYKDRQPWPCKAP